jgi:phosphatidylserine decarboxylase
MGVGRTAYRPMPRQGIIAREGYPFVAAALVVAAVPGVLRLPIATAAVLFVAVFVAFFFRNPARRVPEGEGLIVAPADGRVLLVKPVEVAPITGRPATMVSIFMSVFNVHLNRFPVAARVKEVVYNAGSFLVASLDKASHLNERNALLLEDAKGRAFVVVQIAGLIARRIVCYAKEGDEGSRGALLGLIRFGSRVDLYLPPEATVELREGDRATAGETIVGRLR